MQAYQSLKSIKLIYLILDQCVMAASSVIAKEVLFAEAVFLLR